MLNKDGLKKVVSDKLEVTQKDAEVVLDVVFESLVEGLLEHGKVKLPLGTFEVRERKARKGRNPQTGEEIEIAAKNAVKFKASKQLENQVK